MTKLLIRLFIPNASDMASTKVRERYGTLSSVTGICCNILLFAAKLIVGLLLQSISVMADSFNNLSDTVSAFITLFGFRLSSKPADQEHPFGHGRTEYIASLIVSFIIMLIGYEFLKSSIDEILHPAAPSFSIISITILCFSVLAKVWLSLFYRHIGKRIQSHVLIATAIDSRNDVIVTSTTIFSVMFAYFTGFDIDGYAGVLVACFLLYSGFNIAKETLSPLLGEKPDPALAKGIMDMVKSYEGVVGAHDLMIHNYGPSRIIATVHVEVPDDVDVNASHSIIDRIEHEVSEKYHALISIHMDPVAVNDEGLNQLKTLVRQITAEQGEGFDAHEFRLIRGARVSDFMFELQVPHQYPGEDAERLVRTIQKRVKDIEPSCHCVIHLESGYV